MTDKSRLGTGLPEIARQAGPAPRNLSHYLQQLLELGYVERRYPLTGEPPSARAGRYDLSDPLLLVKCLQRNPCRDALPNSFLKTCDICDIVEEISEPPARRAALLRRLAPRGSAVDALVIALAGPGGTVTHLGPWRLRCSCPIRTRRHHRKGLTTI